MNAPHDQHGRRPPGMSELLEVIRQLVGEVNPRWKNLHFTPDTLLERELGLDSMARTELHVRIEQTLNVSLPDGTAVCSATANDLMRAIQAQFDSTHSYNACAEHSRASDAADLLMGSFGETETVPEINRHSAAEWLFALYAWPVFAMLGLLTWLLVVLTPFERGRRKIAHWCARALFALTFTTLKVRGHEQLDPHNPQIIVVNHASYLDGFIITAALDIPIHFIVKGELAANMPVRVLLERFGVEFVDRFNANKGASDVTRIANKSRNGQSIVFFPEGTFTTFAGLQPFRMGAFVTASRARIPLVPVAINGAREILRGDHWFPRRGRIEVTVCKPITPAGKGWQVALDLRDAARREIAEHCGEVDLVAD